MDREIGGTVRIGASCIAAAAPWSGLIRRSDGGRRAWPARRWAGYGGWSSRLLLLWGLLATATSAAAVQGEPVAGAAGPGQAAATAAGGLSVPASGPCSPAVIVEGDQGLGAAIASALLARGLGATAAEGCPVTRVVVYRRDPHILVLLRDELRRTQRQVVDRETAVSLIESWVRSDLSAPLLLGSVMPMGLFGPSAAPESPPPAVGRGLRGSLSLNGLAAGDFTGHAWLGASLRGCVHVYRLCIGGAWQMLGQLASSGNDGRRFMAELFALVALPLRTGRVWLWPSLGLGVSWLHIWARLPRTSGSSTEIELEDGTVVADPGVAASADQGHMQAELRLELAIPLRHGLSIGLAAALDATLTSRDAPLLIGPLSSEGEPSTGLVQLNPPPWGLLIGQLGLQWSPR